MMFLTEMKGIWSTSQLKHDILSYVKEAVYSRKQNTPIQAGAEDGIHWEHSNLMLAFMGRVFMCSLWDN